jgi:ATP-dependent DNA helicase 2 subunit 2
MTEVLTDLETNNSMSDDPNYQNITTYLKPQQILLKDIHYLKDQFFPNKSEDGDAISALILAIQLIEEKCKALKFIRKIVLITDARGAMDGDDNDKIAKQITSQNIELSVIGVDFHDADSDVKEEATSSTKAHNENMLRALAKDCNGTVTTLSQALEQQQIPDIRPIRTVASFKGQLTLGDTDKYEDASIAIDVERYSKVMLLRAISAKLVVNRSQDGDDTMDLDGTESVATIGNEQAPSRELAGVSRARSYVIDDPENPGVKTEVQLEDLNKGFTYGRTAVDISKDDAVELNLETSPGLQIVGFVERSKVRVLLELHGTFITFKSSRDILRCPNLTILLPAESMSDIKWHCRLLSMH